MPDYALKRAKEMEKPAPGDAMDLYEEVKQKFYVRESGKAAAAHVAELKNDRKFMEACEAWKIFQTMRKRVKSFKVPQGAKPTCEDKAFARTNAHIIKRIRNSFIRLQDTHPSSRAMFEARSLARRYAIDVPIAPLKSTIVTAAVRATVTRTSKPLTVEQVFPYTEVFICTEYKIEKLVSGDLYEKRIITMQLAMREAKYLPPARHKPGESYILKLGPWSEQTHYHAHPAADDINDPDATLYFVFSSERVE